jgi:putative PIG3 family NAD(P)H quinone oxidoreductase
MKAVVIREPGGPEVLQAGEWEKPVPGDDEILVRIAATALNRADTLQRRGRYPPPAGASPILGLEMSGEVAEVGSRCTRWKPGDRVFGLLPGGGYAEYAVIHEQMAMAVPVGMTMTDAAAIPEVFLTAFQALVWHARLMAGETILIHAGASGVGTAAIQIARQLNAEVLVTASTAKLRRCRELGASHAIDYTKGPFEASVLSTTDKKGVDVIIDFVAGPYFHQNIASLKPDGRLVLLAALGGGTVEQVDLRRILTKRLTVIGSTLRARSIGYQIRLTDEFTRFAIPLFADGTLRPIVDSVFDWRDVVTAHEYMEANRNTGKIVLRISGS